MNEGMLTAETGLPERMTKKEASLLKRGFTRVALDTEPAQLVGKQYSKREVDDRDNIFHGSIPSVILLWRE